MIPMQKRKITVVAGIIYNQAGEIFVAQRNAATSFGLMWEFPGGKVEINENHPQALKRELAEELGIIAVVNPTCYLVTLYEQESLDIELHFYKVEGFQGEISLREHADSKWLPVSELGCVNFAPADLDVVAQLQQEDK